MPDWVRLRRAAWGLDELGERGDASSFGAAGQADVLLYGLFAHCGTTTGGRLRQWLDRQLRYRHPPKANSPHAAGCHAMLLPCNKLI